MPDTDTTQGAEGMEQALDPFARVYRIQPPGKDNWPDDKPNSEFIPGAWPTWGDFKRAAVTLDACRRAPTPPGGGEDGEAAWKAYLKTFPPGESYGAGYSSFEAGWLSRPPAPSPGAVTRETLADWCCEARNSWVGDGRGGPDVDYHYADFLRTRLQSAREGEERLTRGEWKALEAKEQQAALTAYQGGGVPSPRPGKEERLRAFERLETAVRAFVADEDRLFEELKAEGKKLEDYGFPFPLMVQIREALAALRPATQGEEPA